MAYWYQPDSGNEVTLHLDSCREHIPGVWDAPAQRALNCGIPFEQRLCHRGCLASSVLCAGRVLARAKLCTSRQASFFIQDVPSTRYQYLFPACLQ